MVAKQAVDHPGKENLGNGFSGYKDGTYHFFFFFGTGV
jgi:hypothetical protein